MKTVTVEVKTLYTIDIQFSDFAEIFSKAKTDEWKPKEAFKEFNLEDTTLGNLRKCFETLKEVASIRYLVDKLGFDGIDNYGHYNKRKGVYTMRVYDRGDTRNGSYNMEG